MGFEESAGRLVVGVVAVCGGDERAGVDEEHSVAPEPLSQQLVRLSGSSPAARGSDRDETKSPPGRLTAVAAKLFESVREGFRCELVDADAAPGGLLRKVASEVFVQMHGQGHRLKIWALVRRKESPFSGSGSGPIAIGRDRPGRPDRFIDPDASSSAGPASAASPSNKLAAPSKVRRRSLGCGSARTDVVWSVA